MGRSKIILVGAALAVCAATPVVAHGFVTTFGTWPWTTTKTYREGSHRGFVLGSTKAETLRSLIASQARGEAVQLTVRETEPRTYVESYRGDPAQYEDLQRVSSSDWWHLGLAGCNCWLELEFEAGRLAAVKERLYRGPTE